MLIGVMERHAMQPRSRQLALILNHPRIPNRPQNHPPTHSKLATKAVRRARIARVAHARQRLGSRGATPRISACRRKGSELGRAAWLLRIVRPALALRTSVRRQQVGASILVGNGSLFMAWTPQTETQTKGLGGSCPNILFKIIFAFSPAWLVTIWKRIQPQFIGRLQPYQLIAAQKGALSSFRWDLEVIWMMDLWEWQGSKYFQTESCLLRL